MSDPEKLPVEIIQHPVAEVSADPVQATMQIIAQASANPNTDAEKMQLLLNMRKDQEQYESEKAFWKAFPAMQNSLPTIPKRGVMKQSGKNGNTWEIPFARFEDVIETIRPILKKHGFGLTYKHHQLEGGVLQTIGILSHKGGHVERDEFEAPHDTSGSKNATQAIGSSRAYGKRYTTGSLLGLAFGGEDDDAASTDSPIDQPPAKPAVKKSNPKTSQPAAGALVTEGQVRMLNAKCKKHGVTEGALLGFAEAKEVAKILRPKINEVIEWIEGHPTDG
jgi:hypothetical protein